MNVLVNGAHGKLGQIAVKAIESSSLFTLVGKTSRQDNLSAAIRDTKAKIVIDTTIASSAYQNALAIIEAHAHPVIGTTGLSEEQIIDLQKRCQEKKLGGIIAPNFSLGALLMMKFAQQAAHYFQFAEIIEAHHEKKRDAPSGTATLSAKLIAKVRKNAELPVKTEVLQEGARGAEIDSIPVHAIRLPGFLAHQEIIFGDTGETFTLTHNTISRECYIPGILLACQKVTTLDKLVVGLERFLTLF
jgi:4-hydroxy-tetrahydrodipicolinate reductase